MGHEQGNPIKSIMICLKKACQRAKIEDFRFHDLLHTFNTIMGKAGVPKSIIMYMTGHKISVIFDKYNTIDE